MSIKQYLIAVGGIFAAFFFGRSVERKEQVIESKDEEIEELKRSGAAARDVAVNTDDDNRDRLRDYYRD